MSPIQLLTVIAAIAEVGKKPLKEGLEKRESIVRVLKKFHLDPEHPPSKFGAVYMYALVEYGVGKQRPILELFRHEKIRKAFRRAFEQNDISIVHREVDRLLAWSRIGDEVRKLGVDAKVEFVGFTEVFNGIVDRTRKPAEVRQDHALEAIKAQIDKLVSSTESFKESELERKGAQMEDGRFQIPHTDVDVLAEKIAEKLGLRFETRVEQQGQVAEADPAETQEVSKEIDEAVGFIEVNNIEDAKTRLHTLLGKTERRPRQYRHELARIYNNLGVCFNRAKAEGGDFDKAEDYFLKSQKAKPDFNPARSNLAAVYLNQGGKDNYAKAYDVALPLWEGSDKTDPLVLQILLWSIYHHESVKHSITYYEDSDHAKQLVRSDTRLLTVMAGMYTEAESFDKAKELIDEALSKSPNTPFVLVTKARIMMGHSVRQNVIPSEFEVVPRFQDYNEIEEALAVLHRALELAESEKNPALGEQVKTDMHLCSLWLRRADEAKYRDLRKTIHVERLDPMRRQQLKVQDFAVEVQARNFETAHRLLVYSPEWPKMSYGEKLRLARVFLFRGSPEKAKDIFKQLELDAERLKDVRFWLDVTQTEMLLNDKNLAIRAIEKAKAVAEGTENEKPVLSNFNAVMFRYAREGEVDRLMEAVLDYQKKYPGEEIMRPVKAIDEKGGLTDEMKSILERQKEWYERTRQSFRSQPVPTYALEEILGRPYADILCLRNDPEFIFELNVPDARFQEELLDNLVVADDIVFDYASLLNLSKMNLLAHLPRFGKRLSVARELFDKIQNELLSFEHVDLRRLWQFLRTSKEIDLVEETAGQPPVEDVSDILGKWVVPSMRQAKSHSAVFMADDLRFLLFLRSERIKGCNTLVVLKYMLEKGWIDQKVYSTSLGDLAERCYVFLSFSGEDLYRIAMEDEAKITLRSYHLVNQLLLPGSNLGSFIAVFVKFIDLVWKTGSLPEDKVKWLRLLSNKIKEFVDKHDLAEKTEEHTSIINSLLMMWSLAAQGSSKDEIAVLEKKAEEVFDKPYLKDLAGKIRVVIDRRKEELSPKPSK